MNAYEPIMRTVSGIITDVNEQYWFNAKIAFVVLLIYSAIGLVKGINESK